MGLLTYALQRKPAFAAHAARPERAPAARREAPAAIVGRARLRGAAGLAVTVTPRATGAVVVELRRGGRRARPRAPDRPRRDGAPPRAAQHARARAGRHVVSVSAARAGTVRRGVRVR